MNTEVWKEVLGFDILYEVSSQGRVRTRFENHKGYTDHYHFLHPVDNGNGYLRFNWRKNGQQKTVYLHRLVAEAFVSNPNGLNEINHKDENKTNNTADNLEWCDHAYNCAYGTRNDRSAEKRRKKVLCVETGTVFKSVSEAARIMQVVNTAISNCLNGRSKSACGYTWEYCNEQV